MPISVANSRTIKHCYIEKYYFLRGKGPIWWLFLLGFCISCAKTPASLDPPTNKPLPHLNQKSSTLVSELLEKSVVNVRSFRGLASVIASKPLGKQELTQTFVFSRPDNLRMDVFTPGFNQLVGLLLVKQGTIQLLDLQEKTLHVGSADPYSIGHLLGVPLNIEAFMLWLCGQVAPSTFAGEKKIEYLVKGENLFLLKLATNQDIEILAEFALSAPPKRPIFYAAEIRERESKNILSSTRFLNAQKFILEGSPIFLPKRIELSQVSENISITLDFENQTLNPPLSPERIFAVNIPKDVTRYAIE